MQFNPPVINAICEAAEFFRKDCYNPLDPESVALCSKIDRFVLNLSAHKLAGLTLGEIQNCCIFLTFFIENAPACKVSPVHRSTLAQLVEILETLS